MIEFGKTLREAREAKGLSISQVAETTRIMHSIIDGLENENFSGIEFGKIANMTVYDCDFLHDDIDKVAQANLVATIVDGEEVYKA